MTATLRIALAAILLLLPLATAANAHAETAPCHADGSMEAVMQIADSHAHMATEPSPLDAGRKMAGSHACCDLGSCSPALLAAFEFEGETQVAGLPLSIIDCQRTGFSRADAPPPRG